MALGVICYYYGRCRIKAVSLPQPAMNGVYWISSRRSRSGAHARTDCSSVDTWLRMSRVGSYPQALWGPLTPLHPFRCRFFLKNRSLKNSREKVQSTLEKGPSSEEEKTSVRRRGVRWCRRRLHASLRLSRCPDNVTAFPCAHLAPVCRGSKAGVLQEDVG